MSTLHAEWTKIRTVRSTVWTLLPALVLTPLIAYYAGSGFADSYGSDRFDPLFPTFYSLTLGQLALAVFGVLAIGAEFSSGSIRSSLIAVPGRTLLFGSKIAVVALTVLGFGLLTVPATFFAAQAGLGPKRVALGDPGVAQAMIGAICYLILICLLATGLTAMLRSSIGALVILLPLLFLGGAGLGNIPQIRAYAQYLPDQAGMVIMHLTVPDDPQFGRDYGPWTGLGIMALWVVAALVGGLITLRRHDA